MIGGQLLLANATATAKNEIIVSKARVEVDRSKSYWYLEHAESSGNGERSCYRMLPSTTTFGMEEV